MFGDTIHQLPSVPPSSEDSEAQIRKTLSKTLTGRELRLERGLSNVPCCKIIIGACSLA
jgi:hypothetical protein